MLPEIEKLLVLQDRDQRIQTLRTALKNIPLERADFEARMAAANQGAEKAKLESRALEAEKNKLATEAQAQRDAIARFKVQQMQTRKNEEFQAMAHQISHAELEIQRIEDRELDVMERIEAAKPVVAEAEKKAADARALVAAQLADHEAKGAQLKEQLAAVEADRATLTQGIDEDLLDSYQRLFATKGGRAVVELEHEVCGGCHMKLTAQTFVRVRGGKEVVQCEQCGRILYGAE